MAGFGAAKQLEHDIRIGSGAAGHGRNAIVLPEKYQQNYSAEDECGCGSAPQLTSRRLYNEKGSLGGG